jgi:exopolysaccharide biosynthesis polyprenyl glycosylphosphotransferase
MTEGLIQQMFDHDDAIRNRSSGTYAPRQFGVSDLGTQRRGPALFRFLLRRQALRRMVRVTLLLLLDFAGVLGALMTATLIKLALQSHADLSGAWGYIRPFLAFTYMLTVLLFARGDLYSDRPRRAGLPKIATVLFQVTIVALIFALANGQHFQSYYVFYSSLLLGIGYITGLRSIYTRVTGELLERAGYRRRTLLIGSGRHLATVAHTLSEDRAPRFELVGYVSESPLATSGLRSLGGLDEVPEILGSERVEEIIIADPDFPPDQAVELVDRCHRVGVTVNVAPSTMEILFDRAEFVPGDALPLFALRPPVFEGLAYAGKRIFDLSLSLLLLIVLSPGLVLIAAFVRLSSRGPVIYRSVRPGLGGRTFDCFKFRTMRADAEQSQAALEDLNESTGALFKIRNDPRLTAVGRFLRRFSLDELPQLVNVIRGDMSLVGPRPLPLRDFERLDEWHKKRYLVLPGITGLWQVSGRSELDFDELVRLDFLYLERWSVFLDLTILLKTIPAVLSRRGAF